MLAPKYMLRSLLSALMLWHPAERVPGLAGWRHGMAR